MAWCGSGGTDDWHGVGQDDNKRNGWYRNNKRDSDVNDEQELDMEYGKRNRLYRHFKRGGKVDDDVLVNEEDVDQISEKWNSWYRQNKIGVDVAGEQELAMEYVKRNVLYRQTKRNGEIDHDDASVNGEDDRSEAFEKRNPRYRNNKRGMIIDDEQELGWNMEREMDSTGIQKEIRK